MSVTGLKLQLLLRDLSIARDLEQERFKQSFRVFEGEQKDSPDVVFARYRELEERIAKLQTAQAVYNQRIGAGADNQPLALAIKRLGGHNRMERAWKQALKKKESARYFTGSDDLIKRNKDEIYSRPALSEDEYLKRVMASARAASQLKADIAIANAREVDAEELGLTPKDLERL